MNILTVCRAGLVRSVALEDVLKLHFEPTDVLAMGVDFQSEKTQEMLCNWADWIICMQEHYKDKINSIYHDKVIICEVGPDTYGDSHNPSLINQVFNWARENQEQLRVKEHNNVL